MARPNLSVKTMALVDSRWSFAVSHWLAGVRVCRAINDHRPGTAQKGTGAGKSRRLFPFQWLLAKPGRHRRFHLHPQGWFSLQTLRNPCRPLRSKAFNRKKGSKERKDKDIPRRHSQGIPEGWGGRKLNYIIDAPGEP